MMTVLTDILEWSAERPLWQRDALRRIIIQNNLSDEDVIELFRICLAQHDLSILEDPPPTSNPLAREHLSIDTGPDNRVQLIGLREIQGVNALAVDQQMSFGADGLTIIFGYNGSGKSGYARILRSLCHARHRSTRILQNVFANTNQSTPSTTVDYNVGGAQQTNAWQQGQNSPSDLKRVNFFDADCAAVHVNEANELAFTPFGLDVLPKLADICLEINDSINELILEQQRMQPTSLTNPQAVEGTRVRMMLAELDENSNIDEFRSMAELTEQDLERIKELQEALGSAPADRAVELRNKVARLRRLLENIRTIENALCTGSISEINDKLQDFIIKKATARMAAQQAFSGQPLAGVGEEIWHKLWEAARNYSQQQAYPDHEFPFVGEDARCVLCQQLLSPEAQERLATFETFIKEETQQAAEFAGTMLNQALVGIRQLVVGHSAFTEYLPDIPDNHHDLKQSVRRFHGIAWRIKQAILKSYADVHWSTTPDLPSSPSPELETMIRGILTRVEELEQAANESERKTLLEEQNEMLARRWLAGILEDVEIEIERKKKLAILNAAKNDTVTTGITRKSSELADRYVTDVLRRTLATEIENLGASLLEIEMDSAGGRIGQKRFKISLRGAPENTEVRHVLSEGEFRCIALAGFLTELSTEQSGSAIILDDPVCSLDHQWRRKVAYRLVQLASERQVIVFTHDIVFLLDLVGFCEAQNIPLQQSYLHRGPIQPGECVDGVPWAAMKVNRRISWLKNRLQSVEATFRNQGQETYEPEARSIYGLLRETCERAVEEVLLGGVVIRFDRAIHTQQLRNLSDITDDDIRTIDESMTKCSRFLEGHDEAIAVGDPVPLPSELRQDIEDIEAWIAEVRRRRRR